MENFCVTFVFCIDYIEKNGQFMPQELFPFVFLAPKSIKFELLELLPFRKYIGFSTLPGIKKNAHLYIRYLKFSV